MMYPHAFQPIGFDRYMHVVSVGADAISQPDLLSTSETGQLVNMISMVQLGSQGSSEHFISSLMMILYP